MLKLLKKYNNFEIIYILSAIIVLLIVISVEHGLIELPSWAITKNNIIESSSMIFQVQVSIATFTLAILALITGSIKDTLYGVPVIKYVMSIKSSILKYNHIMVVQMILIVVSFLLVSYQKYNYLIYVFILTISNTIVILKGILYNLQNYNDNLKNEIEDYLIKNPSINNISNLKNQILGSKNNVLILQENLRVMVVLVKKNYTPKEVHSSIIIYKECLKSLLQESPEISLCAIKSINDIYSDENNKISINLFENIKFYFYKSLSKFDYFYLYQEIDTFKDLHINLFNNSLYDITRSNISHLSEFIYQYGILENVNNINSSSNLNNFKTNLYQFYNERDLSKIEIINKLNYTRSLIYNMDLEMLNTYILPFNYLDNDDKKVETILAILYIYYLAEIETIPNVSRELKDFCSEFINEYQNRLKYIIQENIVYIFSYENIELSSSVFQTWELQKTGFTKWKHTLYNFIVFCICSINSYSFEKTLGTILSDNIMELYTQFSATNINQYIDFCKLFDLSHTEDDISRLQSFLSQKYKESEVKKLMK